ncbi:hypothetical protein [Candidatus Chlorohelix allophototropha]
MLVEFDDGWIEDEVISVKTLPKPLRGKFTEAVPEEASLPDK